MLDASSQEFPAVRSAPYLILTVSYFLMQNAFCYPKKTKSQYKCAPKKSWSFAIILPFTNKPLHDIFLHSANLSFKFKPLYEFLRIKLSTFLRPAITI